MPLLLLEVGELLLGAPHAQVDRRCRPLVGRAPVRRADGLAPRVPVVADAEPHDAADERQEDDEQDPDELRQVLDLVVRTGDEVDERAHGHEEGEQPEDDHGQGA